jgi:protein-L-isoaspartate(D-aspartate) O-methyltransferase
MSWRRNCCILISVLLGSSLSGPTVAFDLQNDPFAQERENMVEIQIIARGVESAGVLEAMREVPRHLFVPEDLRDRAYADRPQYIGSGQTISQPYIVALMTELLELDGDERVLEIGTGSGYQAAVVSRLAREVYTIEIIAELAERAQETLTDLGYDNIHFRVGDGYEGWSEAAPFDAIVVTAAPPELPAALVEQLAVGGRLVVPVGGRLVQDLEVHTKTEDGLEMRKVIPVRFVPMVPGD